ncbi:MAG TPA: hypothetical protein VFP68_02705 [Burkholderiaceae bacterium]|nr:hypothetical protein [Burkholderiaceae bacterium]
MTRQFIVTAVASLLLAGTARADIVIICHPSAGALSPEQVAEVYQGKSNLALPIDLPEASGLRNDFYKKVTGKEPGQIKALWARLAFSGKALPPREMGDASAVKKAVAADPKAIGYIDKSALDASVKVLLPLN